MIVWKKWGVRIADYFFDERFMPVPTDVIRYHQWSSPVAGCVCTPFWTPLIDLRQAPNEIFDSMGQNNRRKIRQCENKDSLLYCCSHDNSALLHEVFDLHDKFVALKTLPKTNRARLEAIWRAGHLDISLIRDRQGNPLVWSIYHRDSRRARNLLNGSLYRAVPDSAQRSLIGRAHRYEVWRDILRFKNMELETYDLGGWYMGRDDADKLRINAFKKEFGGAIEKSFNCVQGRTLLGKVILALSDLRERWMSAGRSDGRMNEARV
jgi:hypothetical protein